MGGGGAGGDGRGRVGGEQCVASGGVCKTHSRSCSPYT